MAGIGNETYQEVNNVDNEYDLNRIKDFSNTGEQDSGNQRLRNMIAARINQLHAKNAMNQALGQQIDLAQNFNPEDQVNLGRATYNEQSKAGLANALAQNQAGQNRRGMMFGAGQNMGLINQYGNQGVDTVSKLRAKALNARLAMNAQAYKQKAMRQNILSEEEKIRYNNEIRDKESAANAAMGGLGGFFQGVGSLGGNLMGGNKDKTAPTDQKTKGTP